MDGTAPRRGSAWKWWVTTAIAAIAAVPGFFLLRPALTAMSCERWNVMCEAGQQQLTQDEADAVVFDFFSDLGGSNPDNAYRMLPERFQKTTTVEEWKEQYDTDIWVEVVDNKPVANRRNEYQATVWEYQPDSVERYPDSIRHRQWVWTLRLSVSDPEHPVVDVLDRRKVRTERVHVATVVLRQRTNTYTWPSLQAAQAASLDELRRGGYLIGICQTVGSQGADDIWTRTELGWVPNRRLTVNGTRVDGLGDCRAPLVGDWATPPLVQGAPAT